MKKSNLESEMEYYGEMRRVVLGYANQMEDEIIEHVNGPGGLECIGSAIECSLEEMYEELKPEQGALK